MLCFRCFYTCFARFSAPVVAGPEVAAAVLALNAKLPGNRAVTLEAALASTQRELSLRVDSAGWDSMLLTANPTARATLFSEAGAGARRGEHGWSRPSSLLSFVSGCGFLKPLLMLGAGVTESWTAMDTMPACVSQGASEPNGTTLSET